MVLEKHDMVLYLICKRERLYYVYNATPNINLLVKEVPCASLLQWYYFCLYLLALYRVLWGSVSTSFKQIMMTSSNGNIFPRYWPFVRGIHRSPMNSPHQGQWRGALMFSLTCVWINGWVNNREAGDLRRYRANYDVIVLHITDYCCLKLYNWKKFNSFMIIGFGSPVTTVQYHKMPCLYMMSACMEMCRRPPRFFA